MNDECHSQSSLLAGYCGASGILKGAIWQENGLAVLVFVGVAPWHARVGILLPRRSTAHHSPPLRVQLTPRSKKLTSSNLASITGFPVTSTKPHLSSARTGTRPDLSPEM